MQDETGEGRYGVSPSLYQREGTEGRECLYPRSGHVQWGSKTGEERLSEINEELKRLRKEVRMTVQIEKHSLEIEARLQEAEEQSQNEKRVEDKERMQKSQEVR